MNNDHYDPHLHRHLKRPHNNVHTLALLLKSYFGTGLLAIPMAYAQTGYVNGVIFTLIMGVWLLYSLHILLHNMYIICKRRRIPHIDYSDAMKFSIEQGPPILRCLARIAIPCVDGAICMYQFGICCVYVLFVAENIKQIADTHLTSLNLKVHICMLTLPLLLIFSIRNLWLLIPFSIVANFLILFGFCIILYYINKDLPSLSSREPFKNIEHFPIFYGTIMFSMESVCVVLAIEKQMAKPKDFVKPWGILNLGFSIVAGLYAAIGFCGYWRYGTNTEDSVTLNIPQGEFLSDVTKAIYSLAVFLSYALQGFVVANLIWIKYIKKRIKNAYWYIHVQQLIRATFVVVSVICTMAVPQLILTGSFWVSILGGIWPILMKICLQYKDGYGKLRYKLVIDILMLICGILGWLVGIYGSVVQCITEWS